MRTPATRVVSLALAMCLPLTACSDDDPQQQAGADAGVEQTDARLADDEPDTGVTNPIDASMPPTPTDASTPTGPWLPPPQLDVNVIAGSASLTWTATQQVLISMNGSIHYNLWAVADVTSTNPIRLSGATCTPYDVNGTDIGAPLLLNVYQRACVHDGDAQPCTDNGDSVVLHVEGPIFGVELGQSVTRLDCKVWAMDRQPTAWLSFDASVQAVPFGAEGHLNTTTTLTNTSGVAIDDPRITVVGIDDQGRAYTTTKHTSAEPLGATETREFPTGVHPGPAAASYRVFVRPKL